MFRRDIKPRLEHNSGIMHPEHEERNTRVSEYLRKYGQGKIDSMPTDNRPVVNDSRSVDEMLEDSDITNHMGTDQLDAIMELDRKKADFEYAFADIELTKKQKEKFDAAVKVLNDRNSSYEQRKDAERILNELQDAKKVKRVRD